MADTSTFCSLEWIFGAYSESWRSNPVVEVIMNLHNKQTEGDLVNKMEWEDWKRGIIKLHKEELEYSDTAIRRIDWEAWFKEAYNDGDTPREAFDYNMECAL